MKIFSRLQREWWIYFLSAFVLQLVFASLGVFFEDDAACRYGDSWILHVMAQSYLDKGVMAYQENSPTLTQLPGYPFLISLLYQVFDGDSRAMLWLQMILNSLAIPLLVAHLKMFMGGWRHVVGVAMVLDLHRLLYSSSLLTESWIWLLWILAFCCLLRYEYKGQQWAWWSMWLCLSLAAWLKPLAGFFPPLCILGWCVLMPKKSFRIKFHLIGALFIYIIILMPLLVRNYQWTGEFPRYSTISSFNKMYFNVVYFKHQKEGVPIHEARYQVVEQMRIATEQEFEKEINPISMEVANDRALHRKALGLNEYEYCRLSDRLFSEFMKEYGRDYLLTHFSYAPRIFTVNMLSTMKYYFKHFKEVSFSRLTKQELFKTLFSFNLDGFFLWTRVLDFGLGIALPLLACIALLSLGIQRQWNFSLWLCAFYIIYVASACGVNIWGRFRFLFIPFLIILATFGLKSLNQFWGQLRGVNPSENT